LRIGEQHRATLLIDCLPSSTVEEIAYHPNTASDQSLSKNMPLNSNNVGGIPFPAIDYKTFKKRSSLKLDVLPNVATTNITSKVVADQEGD
jgi:hypothetical protein